MDLDFTASLRNCPHQPKDIEDAVLKTAQHPNNIFSAETLSSFGGPFILMYKILKMVEKLCIVNVIVI